MNASVVIGQTDFNHALINGGISASDLNRPYDQIIVGNKFIISDSLNNRVLIYNAIPTTNSASADIVIGQPDMKSSSINQGGTADANTLYHPQGISTDGTKLFITDSGNNRVLIYNAIPTTNNASADVVIGQPNMTMVNSGLSSTKLNQPVDVSYDSFSGKLLVTDFANQRVLIYNSVPVSNNIAADIVVGQIDMNSDINGCTPNNFFYPQHVGVINGKLYIADTDNNRILVYNAIPSVNNASADVVIGQSDFISCNSGATANTLTLPNFIDSDGTKLIINDSGNFRILIFNTIPMLNNASSDVVIGQPDMVTHNQYSPPAANTVNIPYGIIVSGSKLFVADTQNNRELIFNTIPSTNNASANIVIGQQDFIHNVGNQDVSVNSKGLNYPEGVLVVGSKLLISDCGNNRVLVYNTIPISANTAADVVIGQQDLTHGASNQGNNTSNANTLSCPEDLESDGTKLFITDTGNSRILIFNSIPTSNNAAADVVIGQNSFTTNSSNQGNANPDANTLSSPNSVSYDKSTGRLFISDTSNSRILVYNSIPTTNNASANVVIGQPDFVSNLAGTTANRFSDFGIRTVNGKLLIADENNNRVLIYNSIPNTNIDPSADVVIGQNSFTANSSNQGNANPDANTLYCPTGISSDGIKLFIQDDCNNRLLIYNTIPITNNAAADVVIGQPDFTHSSANQGNNLPAVNSISDPNIGITIVNNLLFTTDSSNNRVLIYNDSSENTPSTLISASSNTASSPLPNPNAHPGWKEVIMAGPDFVGLPSFLSDSINAPGASIFLSDDTMHDDVHVSFHTRDLIDLVTLRTRPIPFPWSQGLNTVSPIYDIQAVSAFNGFPEIKSDKPFILSLLYDPNKLFGLSSNTLHIAYFDINKNHWVMVSNPMVINTLTQSIATTTTHFGLYTVTYNASIWTSKLSL